jgi:hypothetical protein
MPINILPTEIVRLHRIWTSILYRCYNPKNKQYKNYGARGIFMCDDWHDFNKFCQDIGSGSKSGLHLDREDNNKGYFKENCRWVSPKVNHRNKRNNRIYMTHIGKICQSELIENIGFTRKQFKRAIEKYGEIEFLEMYKNNNLPKKRKIPNLLDIIGKKFGKITIIKLDDNKSTGVRYFCHCDCGKNTRITRFKLLNGLSVQCNSCSKKGDKNPNSNEYKNLRMRVTIPRPIA